MNTLSESSEEIEPWYKQFWPWFIISLPASAVIAGIITVVIAFDGADSLVVDDYYKAGLAINQQIQEQKNAAKYGYAATLKRLPDNRLYLKFDNNAPNSETLVLNWVHPASSAKDFDVTLIRQTDGSYQSKSEANISGRWYLRLAEKDDWLLKSEINTGKDTIHLTPLLN